MPFSHKKLRTVRVRPLVGHRKEERAVVFEFERFICSRAQIMLVRYHQMTGARGVPSNIPPYIDSPPVPSPALMTGAMTQSPSTLEQVVALTIAEIASLYNEALHYPMDRCALVMQWLKRCLSFSLFSCKHKCFKSTTLNAGPLACTEASEVFAGFRRHITE